MANIPDFPDFKPLELAHGPQVNLVLESMERPISEWSFANLYLFRQPHDYRVSLLDGLVLITARGFDGQVYGFPPWGEGDVEAGARNLCRYLEESGAAPRLFPVPVDTYERHFKARGGWEAEPSRDHADYIYSTSELAGLPGKKHHKRRNRLNKFMRENADKYAYDELDERYSAQCIELARRWCDERCSAQRPSTYGETDAAAEAVEKRMELGLVGGVGLLGGHVAAWCLGEPLEPDCFVVHFEKTLPGQDGIAQAISSDFCKNTISMYDWVNREQDLGDPGLRMAKESCHPARMAQKLLLTPTA